MTPEDVLHFWFGGALEDPGELEARVPRWFGSDAALDSQIRERFAKLPDRALAGELDAWLADPRATVALILVLDQFPRNLYRGDPRAFGFDPRALQVALDWIDAGSDPLVPPLLAVFAYLPLEHAEDLSAQQRCVSLFEELVERVDPTQRERFQGFQSYAARHLAVIARFGRFPHRNEVLGRDTTEEERAWLAAGGDTF